MAHPPIFGTMCRRWPAATCYPSGFPEPATTAIILAVNAIFHIAEPGEWDSEAHEYVAASFATEGFIHCSTADQLGGVVEAFYQGRTDMIVLTIDADLVSNVLVYEDLYDHGAEFPHIYGPIPRAAVVSAKPFDT